MSEPIRDQAARDRINTVFDRNLLVEAGAGSGKTTSLTQRMVAAVAGGHVEVHQMAAITYTRKAAAELKERFQEELEKASLETALQDMHRCYVGTIHSFCASMLRERPVEAGIDPEFRELEESENQFRLEEAWEELLVELKVNDSPLLHQLEAIGVEPAALKEAVRSLANFPDVTIHTHQEGKPDLSSVKEAIRDFVGELKPHLPEREPDKGYDGLQSALRQADRMLRRMPLQSDPEMVELMEVFEKTLDVTMNRWPDGTLAKEFRDLKAPDFQESVIRPALEAWRAYCHPIITEFVKTAVNWYADVRRKNGWVNFQDLLLNTAALLRNYPEVRRYFGQKYRCLLVDEFQDTDPIQTEILFYLTGTQHQETNWQQITPRPGSLFVVGDPKQSIYRFRRADIDLYQQVKNRIRETGGEILELTTNFRSLNSLSHHLNPIFREILPTEASSYQAAYAPMETRKAGEASGLSGPKIMEVGGGAIKKDDILHRDAKNIARFIRHSVDTGRITGSDGTPAVYSDFLILTRYKDSIHLYTRELETLQIPYRVAGGSDFENEREIKEIATLLRALENPADKIHLVAVLRGLFFGFSDDELYQYRRAGGTFSLWASPPENLSPEAGQAMAEALEKLKTYHRWFRTLPFSVMLEKVFAETGLLPSTWQEPEGRTRCGHLLYLLEYLKKEETAGITTSDSLLESLQNLMATGIEEELDITGEENVVRIMNLHKAKGLEAPVVFLAHPFKMVNRPPDRHIKRQEKEAIGGWVYKVPKGPFGSRTLGMTRDWPEWEQEESTYQEAEEDRLLYVAATRAKNALIISRCSKDDKNPWRRLLKGMGEEAVIDLETMETTAPETIKSPQPPEPLPQMEEAAGTSWVESLAEPSYSHTTPTEDKDLKALWETERATGGGKVWGTLVHDVLEILVKKGTVEETVLKNRMKEAGVEPKRLEELKALLQEFQQSPLWQRIQNSPEAHTEVPFHIKEEHEEKPVYLSGIIDLVFREGDGWVIVDYKTDRLKDQAGYEALEKAYQPQIQQYRKVWEEITGETVSQCLVHFLGWRQNEKNHSMEVEK